MKKLFFGVLTLFLSLNIFAFSRPNSYIVKLKGSSFLTQMSFFSQFGKTNHYELSFGSYLRINFKNKAEASQINSIRNHVAVEYIEPNYSCYFDEIKDHGNADSVPEYIKDSLYKSQWSLRNNGHNTWLKDARIGIDLNIQKAWKEERGSQNIIIATVDSGFNYNHRDLRDNLWVNALEKNGKEGIDDDGNGYIDDIHGYDFHNNDGTPLDGHGHGTHVAGIIGASHNKIGVRGVMAKVSLMGLKFLSDKGPGDTLNAALAVDYAIKNGAHIINNSWYTNGKSQTIYDAFKRAKEAGIIIVASAGNKNNDNDKFPKYPSALPFENIITVGAMNARDKKASFSNYGKRSVDIFAPGVKIVSTGVKKEYVWRTGSSMATPMVSGAIGLLLTKYPNMKHMEIKKRLMETSIKNSNYLKYGRSGRLDIYRLLMNITD